MSGVEIKSVSIQLLENCVNANKQLSKDFESVLSKLSRYESALRFYADKQNWMDDFVSGMYVEKRGGDSKKHIYRGDGGEKARQALEER